MVVTTTEFIISLGYIVVAILCIYTFRKFLIVERDIMQLKRKFHDFVCNYVKVDLSEEESDNVSST